MPTSDESIVSSDGAMDAAFEAYRAKTWGAYAEYPLEAYTHFCVGWKAAFGYWETPLTSAEHKLIDKNCDWIAFGHAWRAVMKRRLGASDER